MSAPASSVFKNSTNVRASIAKAFTRTAPRWLSRRAPGLAAPLASEIFRITPPRRRKVSTLERRALGRARRKRVWVDGLTVPVWVWGQSGPTVMVVHGWGGRGGQFHALVDPLVELGYRVVAFDAPGHGAAGGKVSDLVAMSRAVRSVGQSFGPLDTVIAHSLGAASTALALREGLDARRLVLLSPAVKPERYPLYFFENFFGLEGEALDRASLWLEARVGRRLEDISTMDNLMLGPPQSTLIISDTDDPITPIESSRLLSSALHRAELFETRGRGHYRIVRAPEVVEAIEGFLGKAEVDMSFSEQIERELRYRDLRWMALN